MSAPLVSSTPSIFFSAGESGRPASLAMEKFRRSGGRPARRKLSSSPRETSSITAYRERNATPRPSAICRRTIDAPLDA